MLAPPSVLALATSTMKSPLKNLLLLLIVLGVCTGLLEVAVRFVLPQPASWFSLFAAPEGKLPFELQRDVDHRIDTGDADWHVYTDDRGFRRGTKPVAPDDAPILLTIGDSFGFAYGVDYEESFPYLLDVATGTTARVLNASVPGFGPTQHRIRLEELLASGMKPAAVLLQLYSGNDWADCVWDKNVPVVDGILTTNRGGIKGDIKRSSHLYRAVSKAWHQVGGAPQQEYLLALYRPEAWNEKFLSGAHETMRKELKAMRDLAVGAGASLFVVFIPTIESVADLAKEPRPEILKGLSLQLPAEQILAAAQELDVAAADLTPALAEFGTTATYSPWNRHFVAKGNQVAADVIMKSWTDLPRALRAASPP